jgi:hypothetical protein
MKDGGDATARGPAGGEDPTAGDVDLVGGTRAFGIDLAVDPPPSPTPLAPPQGGARQPARPRFLDREQPPHRTLPRSVRSYGCGIRRIGRDHSHRSA